MLSALNRLNNQIVIPNSFDKNCVQFLKEQEYICPVCNEGLLLKTGMQKIWHFSHRKSDSCVLPKESYEHMMTKLSIYKKLNEAGYKPALEKTFKLSSEMLEKYINYLSCYLGTDLNISKTTFGKLLERKMCRPDIAFYFNGNKKIAIEVQKSHLPEEDFILRTLYYYIFDVYVIWIIPKSNFKDRITKVNNDYYLKLNNLEKTLKKYYFGLLYIWDFHEEKLSVLKLESVEKNREFAYYDKEQRNFIEGSYLYYYKSYKKVTMLHTQDNIIDHFYAIENEKNSTYNKIIDTKLWLFDRRLLNK